MERVSNLRNTLLEEKLLKDQVLQEFERESAGKRQQGLQPQSSQGHPKTPGALGRGG